MKLVFLVVLGSLSWLCGAVAEIQYEFVEEWQLWKTQHGKTYLSQPEELESHLVWLSNRKYVESHNNYADIFGYKLAMNSFGDLVSVCVCVCVCECVSVCVVIIMMRHSTDTCRVQSVVPDIPVRERKQISSKDI